MDASRNIHRRLQTGKEVFFASTRGLALVVGAVTTLANTATLVVLPIIKQSNPALINEYMNYQVSKFPSPPDAISALTFPWMEHFFNNAAHSMNIANHGEVGVTAAILFSLFAGPALIGLAAKAKSSFPEKKK